MNSEQYRPINYQTILVWLNQRKIAQTYLFLGEEEYQKEEIIARLKKITFSTPESMEFNYDIFYGDQTDASTIIGVANSFPMLHNWRMIVVKNVDSLSSQGKNLLATYAENPAPFTRLILLANELQPQHSLYKTVVNKGTVVVFYPLFDNQALTWIQSQTYQRGKKTISTQAANLLIQRAGTNLNILNTELDKLLLYVGNKPTIEENDILKASLGFHEENVFSLINAIGYRKKAQSLAIFKQLCNQGEELLPILYLITRHFRLLWQAKELQEQGKILTQIAQILNIKFKKQQTAIWEQIKLFSYEELRQIFELLLQTDLSLKSCDYRTHPLVIELLIFKTCKS